MRRPDIANGRIVFSYQDDLWIVPEEGGMARRLTVHLGVEDFPKFSPDGTRIAYTGDYNERTNALFVIPAEGGEPVQLTWHMASAQPVTWTRDGSKVVFRSRRDSHSRFFKKFFEIPAEGGLPVEMGVGKGSVGTFSPDGKMMAYNRHPERFWWWKRYKGSQNQDVWTYDFETGEYVRHTDYEGNDSWPMWTEKGIYFVSDRENDVRNLYVLDPGSGNIRNLTDYTDHGVTWPSISPDGSKIVFERMAGLYVFDTRSEQVREVVVRAPTDNRINMTSYIDPLDRLRSFSVSPKGNRIVFEARGELYTAPKEHGDVRNLTESPGSRDSGPSWSPDGRWVAYVSDKSGEEEIYLVDQMGKEPERRLTDSGHFKSGVLWSPESDRILFSTEANALYMIDVDDGDVALINRNEHRDIATYDWSPDGRWIAYDFAKQNRARDIHIYDTKEKEHHAVTRHLADDTEPYFTPDGKYLLLLSERFRGTRALCRISLLPEEDEPFIFEDDEAVIEGEEDEDDGEDDEDADDDGDKKKKDKKKEKVVVKIDFDGIEDRVRRVPRTGGRGMRNIQATDKYYYYQIQSRRVFLFRVSYDLYAFNVEKLESDKVASSITTYAMTRDKKNIVYYDGSKFDMFKVGGKAGKSKDDDDKSQKFAIKRKTTMKLDRRAEWSQIFNEGWRVVKYHFYDPNLHGVDWDQVREYYNGLLPWVRTRRELNLLMTQMVGELNASHQGVSGGDAPSTPSSPMAFFGARMVLDEESGLPRFDRIYKGGHSSIRDRSPLDAGYVKVKEGDYLLAIDGTEIEPGENFYKYLVARTRNRITITTNDKPSMKGAVETRIDPVSHEITLRYNNWVWDNEDWVDEKSEDRIGYMHLKDMVGSGWLEFREKFEQYRYKDGIIIDVRYNGGGSIDTRIIDYLERRPYQIQQSRGESPITRPYDVFPGEVVVLINEYSYSDAEVFPSAVKERGLGTVIGVPTLGFVIAVTPHYLIDGGYIRKTFVGIWEKSSGEQLESRGAIPDIYVEIPPDAEKEGRDLQLEKAVEFLMDKIAAKGEEEPVIEIEER